MCPGSSCQTGQVWEEEGQREASWVSCQARGWEQEGRGLFPQGDAGWRHQAMRVDQSATRAERLGLRSPSPICLPHCPHLPLPPAPLACPALSFPPRDPRDLVTGPSASPRTLPTHTYPTLSAFLPPLKGPSCPRAPKLPGNSGFQAYGVTRGICSPTDIIQIYPPPLSWWLWVSYLTTLSCSSLTSEVERVPSYCKR